jgi:hypothetical protein
MQNLVLKKMNEGKMLNRFLGVDSRGRRRRGKEEGEGGS